MAKSYVGEEIGARIRTRLERLGMSQAELARRLNVTPKMISQYVKGQSVPPVDWIVEIAKVLQCSTDELLGHTQDHSSAEKEVDLKDEAKDVSAKNAALMKVIEYCRELMK